MVKCWRIHRFVLLWALSSLAHAAPLSRPQKRRNTWYTPVASAAERVLTSASELLHLRAPQFTFHMDMENAMENLADTLWSAVWTESVANRFTEANPALRFLLEQQQVDDAMPACDRFAPLQGQSRWEAAMSAIFRARSQRVVLLERRLCR